MMIYIVTRNGEVDEVFDSLEAAKHHATQLRRRWNLTEVIERQVNTI